VLLAVGCHGELYDRCHEAAKAAGVEIVTGNLLTLAQRAASLRPLVVILSVDLYRFDPEELDGLVRSVGAERLLVDADEEETAPQLAARVVEASEAARERRGAGEETKTRSGVRPCAITQRCPVA
jgi:hypothetical protein